MHGNRATNPSTSPCPSAAACRLLWDERRITFSDPEEQQLWQFFYRRAGMFKLEFKEASLTGGKRLAGEEVNGVD